MNIKTPENQLKLDLFDDGSDKRENKSEEKEKEEIINTIQGDTEGIIKTIQKRMMYLSNSSDIYEVGDYKRMKKSAENLRRRNNDIDANELMRLMGALKRARHCLGLLNKDDIKGFYDYMKKLPTAEGSSCMIILKLPQYDRILKDLEGLENLNIISS